MNKVTLLKRMEILEQSNSVKDDQTWRDNLQRKFDERYDWQLEFIKRSYLYRENGLCAANRVGKTDTGLLIDACIASGFYPEGWTGVKFEHPILMWCLGYSGEKTRDLLQRDLFGVKIGNSFTGGLIPAHRILSTESMTGTTGAIRSATIKSVAGHENIIQFWSYTQGQHALMGDSVDFFHIDEEPKDQSIYPQVLTRTATGAQGMGGRGILTFTPENGRTDLVRKFSDDPSPQQSLMTVGWDKAPHLTEETKESLLQSFPEHQRDMRTKGIPMLGHGRIYDMSDETILCEPFEIPDHFSCIVGMDFGFDHPQAFVKLAYDRDNDIIYVTNSWKASKTSANDARVVTKSWAANFPIAWPQDGLQREKGRDDSIQQKEHYAKAGFNMIHEHAQFVGGSRSVETGIMQIRERMLRGTFKVFRGNQLFMDEFRQYHRLPKNDGTSVIVKVNDDILDAARYAFMMLRYAKANSYIESNNSHLNIRPATQYISGRR